MEKRGRIVEERIQVAAKTTLVFRDAVCIRVDFSRSTIPNFGAHGSLFEECSFADCVIRSGNMGHLPPVTYRNCDFTGADLRHVLGQFARFEDCRFINARLDRWLTCDAEFVNCTFAGRILGTVFSGRPDRPVFPPLLEYRTVNQFTGNDFSQADLVDCTFRNGIDLDANRWPTDPQYAILRDAATRVGDAVRKIPSLPAEQRDNVRKSLEILQWASQGQRDLLLRRDELPLAVCQLLGLSE